MADHFTIVVVEDSFVGGFLRTVLERRGYHVIPTTQQDALSLLRSPSPSVGLLITNIPQAFAEFGARIPLLYTAAFPDPEKAAGWRRWLGLRKPFQTDDLVKSVEILLAPV